MIGDAIRKNAAKRFEKMLEPEIAKLQAASDEKRIAETPEGEKPDLVAVDTSALRKSRRADLLQCLRDAANELAPELDIQIEDSDVAPVVVIGGPKEAT